MFLLLFSIVFGLSIFASAGAFLINEMFNYSQFPTIGYMPPVVFGVAWMFLWPARGTGYPIIGATVFIVALHLAFQNSYFPATAIFGVLWYAAARDVSKTNTAEQGAAANPYPLRS